MAGQQNEWTPGRRSALIAIVEAWASTALQSELAYHRDDVAREDDDEVPYDTLSALFDVEERAEDAGDRKLLTAARDALIAVGFYRVMPAEEIAATQVSRGTPWAFKRSGVAYTTDEIASRWQFPTLCAGARS